MITGRCALARARPPGHLDPAAIYGVATPIEFSLTNSVRSPSKQVVLASRPIPLGSEDAVPRLAIARDTGLRCPMSDKACEHSQTSLSAVISSSSASSVVFLDSR